MKQCSFLFLLLLVTFNCWGQNYQGNLFFEAKKLKEENGNLHISFDIHVQKHAVKDYTAMRLIPQLYADSNKIEFPYVLIQGNNKRQMTDRWKKLRSNEYRDNYEAPYMLVDCLDPKTDTVLNYRLNVPYEAWMDDAVLVLRQELAGYKDERTLNTFVLVSGVELAPRIPYKVETQVSFIQPATERKQRNKQGQAFLDFQSGRSVILPNFRRNPTELAKIKEAFTELKGNKDTGITGLFIEGYASPEGKYESNEQLSKDRAFALKNHIVENYGLKLDQDHIKVSWTAEDWDGLKLLVQNSNLIQKDEILAIVDNTDIFDGRESKLMKLAGGIPYRTMLKEMFPQLRRVEYQINYTVRDYSMDEAKKLVGKKNELLSQYELYEVAQSYGNQSKEYRDIILDIIPKQFPTDATAHINAAALMTQMGEFASASRRLEKYADNPQAWNVLGVIHLQQGDLDKAILYLDKAAQNGSADAIHNLKEAKKKRTDNKRMQGYKK